MKRLFLIPLIIVLLSGLILGGCAKPAPTPAPTPAPAPAPVQKPAPAPAPTPAPSPTPAKPIKLKFAYSVPTESGPVKLILEPWMEMIEERTAAIGKPVEITVFGGGALATIPEQYDIIPKGITDIGLWVPEVLPGRFPLSEFVKLPHLFPSASVAAQVIQEMFETQPAIQDEYTETKVLWFLPTDTSHLSARTKQIKTLEDLKGMKASVTSKVVSETFKKLGLAPITIQIMDIYPALQSGLLDVAVKNWEAVYSFKWHEVTKYRTALPKGIELSDLMVSMNWDSWNNLPPDVQKVFEETSGAYMSKFSGEVNDRKTAELLEVIKEYDKKVGNPEIYYLPEAEFQKWVEATAPVYEWWIKDMEAKGKPGRAIFEDVLRLIEKYSK